VAENLLDDGDLLDQRDQLHLAATLGQRMGSTSHAFLIRSRQARAGILLGTVDCGLAIADLAGSGRPGGRRQTTEILRCAQNDIEGRVGRGPSC
jgi:hypothetical protein